MTKVKAIGKGGVVKNKSPFRKNLGWFAQGFRNAGRNRYNPRQAMTEARMLRFNGVKWVPMVGK